MKREKRLEKVIILKKWLKEKRKENQEMSAKDRVLKHNEHVIMANERQTKREKVKLNRKKRNERWKKRRKKKGE